MTFPLYFYFYFFPWEERHNLLLWHCVCTLMMPTGLLSLFFCFISKTTSECHGGGTWFSWESPELLRAIFLFQSSPSASRLEGCFMSNAQLTRLRTVVGCSHFFSSFSSRIFCSLEKTRFSKSFNALGLLLKCETRRDFVLF